MKVVLLGGPFEIMDTPFSGEPHLFNCTLGHVFDMDEKIAKAAIRHGAQLVPPEVFEGFDFTAAEVAAYPNARLQQDAPAEFKAKMTVAIEKFKEYRAQLAQE